MEEAAVEVVENFFQMVVVAAGGADVLASAHLADEPRFGGNVVAGDIAAITGAVGAVDRLAIELGEQDVGDRVQHGFGRAFEQVGEADVKLSLAQPDGVVDGDKRIETNVHGRRGRAGTEFAIGFVKNFGKLRGHVEGRVARGSYQHVSIQLSAKLQMIFRVPVCCRRLAPISFFCCFMYSSTSATVLRWSSALESTVSRASVSRNSYGWLRRIGVGGVLQSAQLGLKFGVGFDDSFQRLADIVLAADVHVDVVVEFVVNGEEIFQHVMGLAAASVVLGSLRICSSLSCDRGKT